MQKSAKYVLIAGNALMFIAAVLFFCIFYPYHVHYQEQFQLFEFTWDYFLGTVAVPGGFADWAGRFLTQFFLYSGIGAVIYAALLVLVQLLTFACCRQKSAVNCILSFLPAVALWVFHLDENGLLSADMAIIFSLLAFQAVSRIRRDCLRRILFILAVPVLYLMLGGISIVFVAFMAVREKPWAGIAALALALAIPFVSQYLFDYSLRSLYLGVHYFRFFRVVPVWAWAAVLAILVTLLADVTAGKRGGKSLAGVLISVAACAAMAVTVLFALKHQADFEKEELMEYDFLTRFQKWDSIIAAADRKSPSKPLSVACLNLALAQKWQLADRMFGYFQNGPDGLLPPFVRDFTSPLPTAEAFFRLGMVNTAQRYTFEAQESIPDYQKSARCYRRLAETNIINGDYDVARKYLHSLKHTIFYRQWASFAEEYLNSGEILEHSRELSEVSSLRLRDHDFLFSDTEMDSMIGLLTVENGGNMMAIQYLMAHCLLKKDIARFCECYSMIDDGRIPSKSYHEALLLAWVGSHSDFEGLPLNLSGENAQRITRFIRDYQQGTPADRMEELYGDTYWFYYYYRYQ